MSLSPLSVAYLDLPIEKGLVQLRTGPRHIDDIDEIAEFVRSLSIRPLEFFRTSNVNLSWRVDHAGEQAVFSLGPKLVGDALLPKRLAHESGFLSPLKFIHARSLSHHARIAGIPTPQVIRAGTNGIDRPWCLQELARGQDAIEVSSENRRVVLTELGTLMARLHNLETICLEPMTMDAWYRRRVRLATDWLVKKRLMSKQDSDKVRAVVESLLSRVSDSVLTPIHGDLIEHNVFVQIKNGRPRISDITDWETCLNRADPRYEALLTAWWAAGEFEGDPKIFQVIMNAYHASDPPTPIDCAELDDLLMLADLTWYVNVLPFTYLRERHRFDSRYKSIQHILSCHEQGLGYLPPGW